MEGTGKKGEKNTISVEMLWGKGRLASCGLSVGYGWGTVRVKARKVN